MIPFQKRLMKFIDKGYKFGYNSEALFYWYFLMFAFSLTFYVSGIMEIIITLPGGKVS